MAVKEKKDNEEVAVAAATGSTAALYTYPSPIQHDQETLSRIITPARTGSCIVQQPRKSAALARWPGDR
jgi:hypothetical protein